MNKKAIIIVDMQKGFMTKENYKTLNLKINNYLKNNKYDKIFLTKFINKQNSLYETKLNWTAMQDCSSQSISIDVPESAFIFEKYGYGLSQNQLEEIKNLGLDEIDVCGLETEACVYAIAFQLFDIGIFPNILINYVATSPEREEIAKQMLIRQFGKVDERE